MSGKTVSGVIPVALHDVAQQVAEYEGTSMSAVVSSALALYLGLSGASRRTARYVLASGSADTRDLLLEGCGRAIARAGDEALRTQLAARGKALGLHDQASSEEQIARDAVEAVREARAARRRAADEVPAETAEIRTVAR